MEWRERLQRKAAGIGVHFEDNVRTRAVKTSWNP